MRIFLELKIIIILHVYVIKYTNIFVYKRKVYGKLQTNNSQYLHFTAMRIGYSSRLTFGYRITSIS